MNNPFTTIIPFAMTGVIMGFLFTAGDSSAGRRMRPPSFFTAGGNPDAGPPGSMIHRMATLWYAVRSHDLYTTSGARATRASAFDEARAMLLSAAHTHGWAGLDSIATDALSVLGTLRSFDAGAVRDEQVYIRQFICHVLIGVLSGHSDSIISPGVLQDISSNFARAGQFSVDATAPFPAPSFDDGGTMDEFITSMIITIATMVAAIIHQVEDGSPEISRAFERFAQNPTLWSRYTQSDNSISVEDIVRAIHQSIPSPRAPINTPNNPYHGGTRSSISAIFAFFSLRVWGHEDTINVDVEAGMGHLVLRDGEVEYSAALFIAALIRFHAGVGVATFEHAG